AHDLLGLFDDIAPKFVKRYLDGSTQILNAVEQFASDVREGTFPGPEHSFNA
ncbi:3-methyl-2-oxobutanoate hydroxymethyltransferase, partial [Magnetococcales bacterium HHB-1]